MADKNVMIPEPGENEIVLGTKRYEVRPLPIGRMKRAKKTFQDALQELLANVVELQGTQVVDEASVGNILEQAGGLLDLLFDSIPQLFSVFVPGIDAALFDDEDNGPTVPQLIEAAQVIIRVNGFDRIPNALRRATVSR